MATKTQPLRRVRQRAKGPIDPSPGQRVREFRQARGLTQAAVAEGEFSKAFISLVESGRTRMSLRAAEIIASRLGVSVSDLLAPAQRGAAATETRLLRAETRLYENDCAGAVRELDGLGSTSGTLRGRIGHLRGVALLRAGHFPEALRALDAALRELRAAGERDRAARLLFDLATVHARLDRVSEATHFALEAERAVSAGDIVDRSLELQILSFLAAAFVRMGDFDSADVRAERAVALAEDIADPRAIARMYATLSITRQEQGDHEAALQYARRSLAVYEALGAEGAVASTWNTIAWVYVQRAQFTRAAEALDRAEALATAQDDQPLLAVCLQTRAELAMARSDFAAAAELAQRSIDHPDVSVRARAGSLLVKAEALGRSDAALTQVTAAFEAAFDALARDSRRSLGRAYQIQFEVLAGRGERDAALTAARRAMELMRAGAR